MRLLQLYGGFSRAMVLTALLGKPFSTVMSTPSMSLCKSNAQNQVCIANSIQKEGELSPFEFKCDKDSKGGARKNKEFKPKKGLAGEGSIQWFLSL